MKKLCPNCGKQINTPYCPRCGQRDGEARLSWRVLWDGTMSTFIGEGFGGETGIAARYGALGTLWQTLRHPVRTITEFLAGQRRKYFNPIALLLLLSGFCALVSSLFGIRYIDAVELNNIDGQQLFEYVKAANEYANTHPGTYMLCGIPFTALISKWIFRPRKLRYIEFLYIGIFTSIISVVVLFITSSIPLEIGALGKTTLQSIPVLCVEVAIYRHIFRRGILRTAANLLVVYGLTTVLLTLIVSIAIFIAAIVYAIATAA